MYMYIGEGSGTVIRETKGERMKFKNLASIDMSTYDYTKYE